MRSQVMAGANTAKKKLIVSTGRCRAPPRAPQQGQRRRFHTDRTGRSCIGVRARGVEALLLTRFRGHVQVFMLVCMHRGLSQDTLTSSFSTVSVPFQSSSSPMPGSFPPGGTRGGVATMRRGWRLAEALTADDRAIGSAGPVIKAEDTAAFATTRPAVARRPILPELL